MCRRWRLPLAAVMGEFVRRSQTPLQWKMSLGCQLRTMSVAAGLVVFVWPASGAPLEELQSASQLGALDLPKLKRGEIVSARGALGRFVRGVHTESCYFVRAPVAGVADALLHSDPTRHPELEVSEFREYRWPAGADVFAPLSLSAARREDRWLIDRTWELANASAPGELHLASNEIASLRSELAAQPAKSPEQRAARATELWRKILHARSVAIEAGGLGAIPTYGNGDLRLAAKPEFQELAKSAPGVAARFAPLTASKPFDTTGAAPDETVGYWEAAQVRGHTGLHNGLLCARKDARSWQIIDLSYYTSDTYFMSMTWFELWPLDDGTLVWQIDFVSAPFHRLTNRIERTFAGTTLLKEAEQWIRLFRRDVEQRR